MDERKLLSHYSLPLASHSSAPIHSNIAANAMRNSFLFYFFLITIYICVHHQWLNAVNVFASSFHSFFDWEKSFTLLSEQFKFKFTSQTSFISTPSFFFYFNFIMLLILYCIIIWHWTPTSICFYIQYLKWMLNVFT